MSTEKTVYVVIAELEVSPANRAEFLELCAYDGERSVADEAGCKQFDVNVSDEAPDTVVLYEVYADKAAFDAHLTTPHYKVFAAGVERLGVKTALVRFFSRLYPSIK